MVMKWGWGGGGGGVGERGGGGGVQIKRGSENCSRSKSMEFA